MNKNSLWDKENFEDLVVKGLLSLCENKVADKWATAYRNAVPPERKISDTDLRWMRQVGVYFAPDDRITLTRFIDTKNDGLPEFGLSTLESNNDPEGMESYLASTFTRRIRSLPSSVKPIKLGVPYVVYLFYPQTQGGFLGFKDYITINPVTGKVAETKYNKRDSSFRPEIDPEVGANMNTVFATAALNFWADRKYLWNVVAVENDIKATFGVYEEQIKSLFYSRTVPVTDTGRKRPILHWVATHKRRMKTGTEITINEFLRGITEFEMNGTIFKITRPMK